jgi:alpha-tubulin suppressor-like RCC1 family protein
LNAILQQTLGNAGRRKRMNVYSFGEAQYSKLGHEKMSMVKSPKLVGALLDKDVIDISFGEKHALALTGAAFFWPRDLLLSVLQ